MNFSELQHSEACHESYDHVIRHMSLIKRDTKGRINLI